MAAKKAVAPLAKPLLDLALLMFAILVVSEILQVVGVLLVDQSFLLGFGAAIVTVFFEAVRQQMIHNGKED